MGKFDGMVGKIFFTAIIMISILSYVIVMQAENSAEDPMINNTLFNESFVDLTANINSNTEDAQEKYSVFNSEEPKQGFGSIVLFGIVSVGKTFSSMIFGTIAIVVKLPLIILGVPESIYNLIIAWLIIVVLVAVWLLYKLGG